VLPSLETRLEVRDGTLWCGFSHPERPCFTASLLGDLESFYGGLHRGCEVLGPAFPIRTLVWHSSAPGIWNLGGDLGLFVTLIRAGRQAELRRYAHACVDAVWRNWTKLDLPVLTIALVQGDALGGGFEAVLTNDVVIAERDSRFGLPESLFNLFPGMGAYSLLRRRIAPAVAEEMIRSGRVYTAQELAEIGLVDVVTPPGEGAAAVRQYLDANTRRHQLLRTLSSVRRRCQALDREELIDVTDLWVEAALALDPADLRRMERLVAAQRRRYTQAPGPARSN
jgi:DSF synthase